MKKISLIFLALFLMWPFSVLGAVSYERTPSGSTIQNPVSFSVSMDTTEDFLAKCPIEGAYYNYWGISVEYISTYAQKSPLVASTTLSNVFVETLLIGDGIIGVEGFCTHKLDYGEEFASFSDPVFEWEGGEIIFEVLEATPRKSFLTIGQNFISSTTGFINDFAGGLNRFIALLIGIPLTFWVLNKVITLAKPK